QQANKLFRQVMFDYVNDYLTRGDAALIEYNDRQETLSLKKEHEALLKEISFVNNTVPDFINYLQNPPPTDPANISKTIGWAKVRFGLKPVIVITQNVTYTANNPDGTRQLFSVSKQVYASRYFDSSLGLTALVQYPTAQSTIDSYMFHVTHSRSSSLTGIFGKLVRKIAE